MTLFFVVMIGLMVGSFLNVCIYRMPDSKSVVMPRSHCPNCKHIIPWYDNIPVLSFIFLRGKCRFCNNKISIRYMIVEMLTAAIFALILLEFGVTVTALIFCILCALMIVATFVDFEHQIIPDEINYGGMGLGLILSLIFPQLHNTTSRLCSSIDSFAGLLVGGLMIYLIGLLGKMIFKKEAMGGGDVKFLAMIGSFVGWKYIIFIFFLAPFFGSFVGIILKLKYKVEIIPYGPYLSLATLVVILWGKQFISYLFPYF
ncbi:MAG: prepilin peptidase [Candidatus Omnitrophota bacterium]